MAKESLRGHLRTAREMLALHVDDERVRRFLADCADDLVRVSAEEFGLVLPSAGERISV